MPTTVGRWALRVPEVGDNPTVPAHFLALATDLSNVAMDDQGVLSARPVSTVGAPSNKPGRYWYVTGDSDPLQNGRLWRDMGSGWVEVAMNRRPVLASLPGSPTTGDEILYQSAAMVTAGHPPQLRRWNGSAWEAVTGGSELLRRGLAAAYLSGNFLATSGVLLVLDAEEFDISGWLNTGNGQFTPQVAGYYRISWGLRTTPVAVPSGDGMFSSRLYKGVAEHRNGSASAPGETSEEVASTGSALVVANGTTDSFGIAPLISSAGFAGIQTLKGGAANCYMHCELVAAT